MILYPVFPQPTLLNRCYCIRGITERRRQPPEKGDCLLSDSRREQKWLLRKQKIPKKMSEVTSLSTRVPMRAMMPLHLESYIHLSGTHSMISSELVLSRQCPGIVVNALAPG